MPSVNLCKISFVILIILLLWIGMHEALIASLLGFKSPVFPYRTTQWGENFHVDSFPKVGYGATMKKVEEQLGKPLFLSHTSMNEKIKYKNDFIFMTATYSRQESTWYSNQAWRSFMIYYDTNLCVVGKTASWEED